MEGRFDARHGHGFLCLMLTRTASCIVRLSNNSSSLNAVKLGINLLSPPSADGVRSIPF